MNMNMFICLSLSEAMIWIMMSVRGVAVGAK